MSTGYHTNGKNRIDECDTTEPRSLSDLIKELRDESVSLVRKEVALAKTEMSEKASTVVISIFRSPETRDTAKRATDAASDFTTNLDRQVRDNPIVASLVGAALA